MEYHVKTLQNALSKLPGYAPKEELWTELSQKLIELPLKDALVQLPQYEPDDSVWEKIEGGSFIKQRYGGFWWVAAAILIVGALGIWASETASTRSVSYTQEVVDLRLQIGEEKGTDDQYLRLKATCEAEIVVCSSRDFKRLKQEYETLDMASNQLKQAMGEYNTEPELVRQFNSLEQDKADLLNEMAKMI